MNARSGFIDRLMPAKLLAAGLISFCTSSVQAQTSAASSSVSLYGLVGLYIDKSKISSQPSVPLQEGGGGLTTSYWGLGGREDLGGGTRIIFALESFLRPTTGQAGRNTTDPGMSRNAYVGLADDTYGTFKFGRQTTQLYITQALLNPLGPSVVFSPLIVNSYTSGYSPTVIGDTVWNRTIGYFSPTINGFSGVAQYAMNDTTGPGGHDNLALHLLYRDGPLQLAASAQRVRGALAAPGAVQYLYLAGATYDLKFVKLYGALQTTNTVTSHVEAHLWELGARVPVTATSAILAEYAMTRQNTSGSDNTIRSTGTIAYDYSLSKRTDIYVLYMADKLTNNGLGNTVGVGIQHTF